MEHDWRAPREGINVRLTEGFGMSFLSQQSAIKEQESLWLSTCDLSGLDLFQNIHHVVTQLRSLATCQHHAVQTLQTPESWARWTHFIYPLPSVRAVYQYITLAQMKLKTFGGNSVTKSIIGFPSSPKKAATVTPLALNRKLYLRRSVLFSLMKQFMSFCSFRKNCKIKKITSHPSLFCSIDNHDQCFGTFSETHLHLTHVCTHILNPSLHTIL